MPRSLAFPCALVAVFCSIPWAIIAAEPAFRFRDAGDEAGLFPALAGIKGHGAGWGDVDGDGWADLLVGTFDTGDSKPCLFFRSDRGRLRHADQAATRISGRVTGIVFADLDNDGDLDAYLGSMPAAADSRLALKEGHPLAACSLLANDGQGRFTDVSQASGACPAAFGGRSVAVLDFDGDGLLDLLVGEDPIPGYNGSQTKSSRLFRNKGQLKFEDASRSAGIPEGFPGLGVAAADVTNDGWPDIFLASSGGGNVLLVNDGHGTFREPPGGREVFAWKDAIGDDMCCGVCIADVNRDGLLDIVLGQHYSRPWAKPVANRLYLNRGIEAAGPRFEDVTERVGLVPLSMKSPHVEIQDFDNDGWPDIYASMVKFDASGRPHPVIFRHLGLERGLPKFGCDALSVNDFPTAEDLAVKNTGKFFEKMIADHKLIYMAPGPTCDYNRDGKLDMLLPSWWPEARSLLLAGETPGGHWLQVAVRGPAGVNRQGIGARVLVYPPGKLGQAGQLQASREIAVGFGYASGQEAIAHVGLGELTACDLAILLPHGKGRIERRSIQADQRIVIDKP
ncbi:MAG TPA: CRTAC1 family protein [Pirellulaceae bacterium]|nr:CRTAC1 family protein [Pirellulaceae bacterium]